MSAPPTESQQAGFAAADRAVRGQWFIVMNQGSGATSAEDKRGAIESALQQAGQAYRFMPVGAGGILVTCQLAAQWAAASGGVLVAAGGDGTLNCAAQAALQHGCPLGIIPQGTFNLFAREHGIPLDTGEAVQALLNGVREDVQVGMVNQRVFLANAAVGLYPKLLEDRETMKEQVGRRRPWVAIVAGLKTLFEWRWQMRLDLEMDGRIRRIRTPSLFVANTQLQPRRLGFDEALVSQVGGGRLVALVAHPLDAWAKLKLAGRAIVGRLGDAREVDCHALRSLDLGMRSVRKVKVATDGEVQWMQLPLRFAVSPRPLCCLLPRPEDRAASE